MPGKGRIFSTVLIECSELLAGDDDEYSNGVPSGHQSILFPCGRPATANKKDQNADSFIFATQHEFATQYMHSLPLHATEATLEAAPANIPGWDLLYVAITLLLRR
jgi:hypothetical protein